MKFSRLRAVARKEFLHLLRDWRSLALGIAIPIVLLLIFSVALSLDVNHVPMIYWDQDRSKESRDFIDMFNGSRYFSVVGTFDGYRRMNQAIDSRKAVMGLVIPPDFSFRINRGEKAEIQAVADGSDATRAQIALGYVQAMAQIYSAKVHASLAARTGVPLADRGVDLRPSVWYNLSMESKDFIIPGLIVVIMMIIAGILTSLTIAREWENGTMEQLISSPLRGPEIILGKLVPYFALGMFDMLLCHVAGHYIFRVPFRGSFSLLLLSSAIFLAGALGIGITISITAKKQLVANQLAILATFLPGMLLSGFIYNIDNMPKALRAVTYLVPARYFIIIIKGIYLKGVGFTVLWFHLLLLTVFAAGMLALAHAKFKKRIE